MDADLEKSVAGKPRRPGLHVAATLVAALSLAAAGCGQKGPLTLASPAGAASAPAAPK